MSGSIVFVGDGLIAGGRWDEWLPEYGIHNLGVSGDTTDELIARLDVVVERQPDAVAVLVGSNDLSWRKSDEYVVRNLETILVSLRKRLPGTRILAQSVLPRTSDFANTIRSINRHLWQFAPTQHAQYLDLWPALALPDGALNPVYTDDCLHLNAAGYEAWMAELKPALEELFERPPSTSKIPIQHV